MMQEHHKKDRLYILVSAAIILPAAFLFYVVSDLPHVFIITCLLFIISLLIPKTIKYTDRSIIYSFVIALTLAVIFNMVFPMKQERFFSIGRLFMSQITVPLLLYLAAISTLYESTPYSLGFNSAFAIIIIMLGGDASQNINTVNEESFFSFLIDHNRFNLFFIIIFSIDILAILTGFNLARKSLFHKKSKEFDWKKKTAFFISLGMVAVIAISFSSLFQKYKDDLKRLERYFTQLRRHHDLSSSRMLFNREVDLNRTISSDLRKNKNVVMIRAEGDRAPGYLRGRSYKYYNNGKWRDAREKPSMMKFKLNIEGLAFNAFYYDKDPGRNGDKFEIYPTGDCLADYLFIPARTNRFDLVADRLSYTQNGLIRPKSWEKDGGYTVYLPKENADSAFPYPGSDKIKSYLQTPKDLYSMLDLLKEDIEKQRKKNSLQYKPQVIIWEIIQYLQKNYKYSLDPEKPIKKMDPVKHFLTISKKGHCELFATSAVLLLRHYNIPSRYVTGFICNEPHPSGKYFVARKEHAHAWAEAYLEDEKSWIRLDATPAATFATNNEKWGVLEIWWDRLKQTSQRLLADIRRGYIARAVLSFLLDFLSIILAIIWHPVRGTLIILATVLLLWGVNRYRKRKTICIFKLDKKTAETRLEFIKFLRNIEKKLKLKRNPNITLGEWLKEIKDADIIKKDKLADFYSIINEYQKLRFSPTSIEDDCLNKIKSDFGKFSKNL